jgi:hypothetical protein
MRLSNSDYWDLFLCYDCTDEQDNEEILSDCILVNIDITEDVCYSGNTLYSSTYWTGSTIQGSGVTLYDIGLTGIDNGLITYECGISTSGETFLSAFTGSTLFLSSGDSRFSMTRVTGCTYDYSINILSGATLGRYSELRGGFYQGFFKLSDKTSFVEITDNKFTWDLEWFRCPPVCTGDSSTLIITSADTCTLNPNLWYQCYMDGEPEPYNYKVLPDRLGGLDIDCLDGWTTSFWLNKSSSGSTGNTLNNLYPNNSGFFFYMGTRSENKFWDLFSGETGYTTSSGIPLPPPRESEQVLLNNPFIVYTPDPNNICFTGVTTVITEQKDRNADIINNALGFRIKDDGSIGYRSIGYSGICSAVTATTLVDCSTQNIGCTGTTTGISVSTRYITGVTIDESYSVSGLVTDDQWVFISIRFKPYEQFYGCELNGVPRRKGSLNVYVNGYLKWVNEDFDEFIFRDLDDDREKQQGVPFNYSWGGGTMGLLESNTVNGKDIDDSDLIIQNNFAGTFEGYVSSFKLYGCSLDVTTIREDYNNTKTRFGL